MMSNNKQQETMNDIIKNICETNSFIEIYTNRNDCDRFATGYIVACTDDEFLLHCFDNNDLDDGYFVMRNDAVFSIKQDTIYLGNMQQFIKPQQPQYELPKGFWMDLDLMSTVLSLCQERRLLVQVKLDCDMVCYGWVKSFDTDVLEIEEVNCDGMADGVSYFRIEEIILVGFGGVSEKRRARLSKDKR